MLADRYEKKGMQYLIVLCNNLPLLFPLTLV